MARFMRLCCCAAGETLSRAVKCARDQAQRIFDEPRDLVLDALNPPEWEPACKRGKGTGHDYSKELMAHVARCKPSLYPHTTWHSSEQDGGVFHPGPDLEERDRMPLQQCEVA